MGGIDAMPVTEQGEALYRDLLWVHGLLRQDLATVERLAAEVAGGAEADAVVAGVRTLETTGPSAGFTRRSSGKSARSSSRWWPCTNRQ